MLRLTSNPAISSRSASTLPRCRWPRCRGTGASRYRHGARSPRAWRSRREWRWQGRAAIDGWKSAPGKITIGPMRADGTGRGGLYWLPAIDSVMRVGYAADPRHRLNVVSKAVPAAPPSPHPAGLAGDPATLLRTFGEPDYDQSTLESDASMTRRVTDAVEYVQLVYRTDGPAAAPSTSPSWKLIGFTDPAATRRSIRPRRCDASTRASARPRSRGCRCIACRRTCRSSEKRASSGWSGSSTTASPSWRRQPSGRPLPRQRSRDRLR